MKTPFLIALSVPLILSALLIESALAQEDSPRLLAGDLMSLSPEAVATGTSKVAFHSNRDGDFEIYLMNTDGSGVTQLTNNPAWDSSPAVSPDGQRIAFVSNRDGNWEIYSMNIDGSGVTRLTNHPDLDGQPAWSPDGRQIAFTSYRYRPYGLPVSGIYIVNVDGSSPTPLIRDGDAYPAWSPDGRKITFHSMRFGAPVYPTDDIWVINVDGSGLTRLTNQDGFDGNARWSPDGSQIVFVRGDGIYVMNADGSAQRRLGAGSEPAWSRDGQHIAFIDTRDGGPCCSTGYNVEVYVMNADGSAPRRLTVNPAYDQGPAWAP